MADRPMIASLRYADGRVKTRTLHDPVPDILDAWQPPRRRSDGSVERVARTFRRTNDTYNGELVYREIVREATE